MKWNKQENDIKYKEYCIKLMVMLHNQTTTLSKKVLRHYTASSNDNGRHF